MKSNLIIIGLVLYATIAYSQEQPTATLKIGTIYDPLPGTVFVPVTCEAIDNPLTGNNYFSSFGWYIAYDTSVLYAGEPGSPALLTNYYAPIYESCLLLNIFPDNPYPGWNTIAIIWSCACCGEIYEGDKFFDIQFTYHEGTSEDPNIIWTSMGNFLTNMADDEGNEILLTLLDGYVGPHPIAIPELKTELSKIWSENGNISFNAASPGKLCLYSLFGQQVMSAPVHPGLNIIPVKDKNTYYIIRVVTNSSTLIQKIFIQ